jgi:hypothetical protein
VKLRVEYDEDYSPTWDCSWQSPNGRVSRWRTTAGGLDCAMPSGSNG